MKIPAFNRKPKVYEPSAPTPETESRPKRPLLSAMKPFAPKRLLWLAVTAVFCVTYLLVGNLIASGGLDSLNPTADTTYYRARVVDLLGRDEQTYPISETEVTSIVTLTFTAEILEGDHAGEIWTATQQSDPYQNVMNEVRIDDEVVVAAVNTGEETLYQYHEHVRINPLIVLTVVFVIALLALGQLKGFKTLASLAFVMLAVYVVLVPAILSGQNVYLWTVVSAIALLAVPLSLAREPGWDTLLAGAGGLVSVGAIMAFSAIMSKILELTGMVDEQSVYLAQINTEHPIDLMGIVFAGVSLSAIGAILELTSAVSSGLRDALRNHPTMSRMQLYRAGMGIGRGHLHTVSNTMLVAYIGISLSPVLLLFSSNVSLLSLMNRELLLVLILQFLAGGFGLLLAIPMTSLLCSVLYTTACKVVYTEPSASAEPEPSETPVPETAAPAEPASPESAPAAEPQPEPQPEPEQPAAVEPTPEELAEQERREQIDAVEESAQRTEAYRRGVFGNFARLYRELDEDFDVADERSKRKHGSSKK